ncbi:Uncharacterised protein (plasmid) [Legionella adelaidensis]|uniref:Transmembrane protein n=1 Tax=Legionella adelaidensis TaxID=45056 RepID=A0A0W0R2M6_9GAMM|nr:hypothetical protein [Legionella adelaidensis]KTC65303.1 hypothetical protein Lade_1325 [Legionella adelaidensis]VEH86047.1 Uncharacterised protein [Legionella adelaidensis]
MGALNNELFKKLIILFWMCWWVIALWTDIAGALAHLKILSASWAPDVNYPFLVESLKMYGVPSWVPALLFTLILVWSFISAGLFCWASFGLRFEREIWMSRAEIAFIVSLSYWFAFFIADQLVMKFDLEQNHMVQGGFQLLTFLSLYLLPET